MKILHVGIGALPEVFSDGGGAVQRRVGELALAQARAGHEVTVASPSPERGEYSREGVNVLRLACRTRGALMHLEFLARARSATQRLGRFDAIHVHNEPEGALFFGGMRAPVVLSFDNFYFRQRWG